MKPVTTFSSLILYVLASVFSLTAWAEEQDNTAAVVSQEIANKCNNYPKQPDVPNGMKASMDEMLAAQKAVKVYQAEAQGFRTCVDNLIATWTGTDEELGKKKDVAAVWHNRSVSDEEQLANMFNTSLRAYKARSQ